MTITIYLALILTERWLQAFGLHCTSFTTFLSLANEWFAFTKMMLQLLKNGRSQDLPSEYSEWQLDARPVKDESL